MTDGAGEFDSLVLVRISKAPISLRLGLNGPTNDGVAAAVFISVCNKCLVNDRAREQ